MNKRSTTRGALRCGEIRLCRPGRNQHNVFMQWHTSRVQSIADSQADAQLRSRAPARLDRGDRSELLNALIGTRFKLVSGYPASNEGMVAMERGEVEGATPRGPR